MSETRAYKVTRGDIEWAGGKRVDPEGCVQLTEGQAEAELARGLIEPVEAPGPAKKTRSATDGGAA